MRREEEYREEKKSIGKRRRVLGRAEEYREEKRRRVLGREEKYREERKSIEKRRGV